MTAPDIALDTTEDRALGGRLTLRQPRRGHRFGHDAILLAAAVEAHGGIAVELGAGVGAAGLALACRVPDLRVVLAEIDPVLAALAQENAQRNGMSGRVRAAACDVTAPDLAARLGLAPGGVDAVLMNPPFNAATRQTVSPDAARRLAHVGDAETLPRWVAAAAGLLKPRGTLTLIWRADGRDDVLAALSGAFGAVAFREVHPNPGKPAIRVLVRAVLDDGPVGGQGGAVALPGLVLNDAAGRPSEAAETVLRHGAALPFDP